MIRLILTLLVMIWGVCSSAQQESKHDFSLGDKAKLLHMNTSTGIVVSFDGNALYGLYDTEELWKIPIKDYFLDINMDKIDKIANSGSLASGIAQANETSVQISDLDNTSFIQVKDGASFVLLNAIDGKVTFDSKNQKKIVTGANYAPSIHSALIFGNITNDKGAGIDIDRKTQVSLVDLSDNTIKWTQPILEEDKGSIFSDYSARSRIDGKGNIYVQYKRYTIKFDASNGDVIWKKKQEEGYPFNFYVSENDKYLVQLNTQKGIRSRLQMNVYDTENGKDVWEEPLKVNNPVFFDDLGSEYILAWAKGFNMYDFGSGKAKWSKGPKGKTKSVIPTEGGYLFLEEKRMQFIDESGNEVWKKDVKISDEDEDEVILFEEKNGKIVYVTSTYVNIVDKSTGEKQWKKNLKLNEKRPSLAFFDPNKNEYIVYNDEELFRFGLNDSDAPKAFAKLKVRHEKLTNNFEITPSGYLISGTQEFALVGYGGKVLSQQHFREAGNRQLTKGLMTAGGIAAGVLGSGGKVYQNGEEVGDVGFFDEATRNSINQTNAVNSQLRNSYFRDRPNNSDITADYLFFFTDESSDVKKVLIQIDKATGEKINSYQFDNARPMYVIDDYENLIYYANKGKISVFDLKK